MTTFLDTDVLIDCLRGTPAARAWLEQSASDAFQVPGVVAMELLMGCQNKTELERTQRFVRAFDIAWPEASEFAQAYELLAARRLNSGCNRTADLGRV
jgi:predicted nucleic acid-binding protein